MDIYIVIGLCLVMFILLVVMYIKDRETEKKFARFEQVLEDSMQEAFVVKKEFIAIKKAVDVINIGDFSDKIDEQIELKIAPIVRSLQLIDDIVRRKIGDDEQEKLIVAEFKEGKSVEDIAMEYNLSYQRVEFVLKLNKMI